MNDVGVKASDGVRIEGFIEVEIINKVDNVRRTYKNTITKGGKQFLLAHSAAQMLNMSASMRGNAMVNGGIMNRYLNASTTSSGSIVGSADLSFSHNYCLTNLLLNLGDLQTGLTENSTYVNLFDSTGVIDKNKVVGYANNNVSPTANGREGSIDYCKDEYVVDGTVVCERWKYPEGVATGTIDTIAMAPAGWRGGTTGLGGQRFSKCIDKVNLQQATFGARSTRFCPPGIAGFTSNDEILINYSQDSVSRHKYNISTGEITDNPTTWFVFPEGTTDIVKIGDYIYSIIGTDGTVYVWLASNMSQVATFSPTRFSVSNPFNYRLVVDGSNNLWISCMPRDSGETSGKVFGKCNNNGTYFNAANTSSNFYEDFSQVFTLPSGWDKYRVNFGMCGQYYVAYLKGNYFQYNYHPVYNAILFTNPADILGSIVDIIPEVYNTSALFSAGPNYGVIDMGYPTRSYDYLDSDTKNRRISNNTGTTYIDCSSGCYLTLNGWYCTLLSFVKLNTPIVKQDTDIMYVSYGYKVV